MGNPYLPQQAQAITNQVQQGFLQNVLPGVNQQAQAAGGFGGSRNAIAQGVAAGNAATGLASSLSNMYGQAYAQDAQLAAQRDMQSAQLANQRELAAMSDATQRLGLQNQYSLGMGNLGLGYTQAGQSYTLGLGNLANQQQQTQNQFTLGQGNLALGNKQADQSYNLGQGNLALGQTQAQNQYNLGLGNLGLGQYQADTQRQLGFGNLGLGQMQANQNFYTSQRGQDLQQLGLGANLFGQGAQGQMGIGSGLYGIGQQQQNAPLNVLQQYGNMLNPFSGLGQSQSSTTPGASTAGSALGGALTAAQLWRLISGGNPQ